MKFWQKIYLFSLLLVILAISLTVQNIAAGNYLERVHIKSKDEFRLLPLDLLSAVR